jgi:hypothetical protein
MDSYETVKKLPDRGMGTGQGTGKTLGFIGKLAISATRRVLK